MSENETLLRTAQVAARIGLGREKLRRLEREGKFPKHFNLGPRVAVWLASDVQSWIEAKISASNSISDEVA